MLRFIEDSLNDAVLGFLALLSLFLLVSPTVFSFSPDGYRVLFAFEYLIVFLFATEYIAAFVLAERKSLFVINRWRLIDALIIVFAALALLPVTPDVLRSSPVLRLLRLGRVALLGTRSSLALKAATSASDHVTNTSSLELEVSALGKSGKKFEKITWEAALDRINNNQQDWLFISGVTEDRIADVAVAMEISETTLQALFQSRVPGFGRLERFSTLFIRYPLKLQAGQRLQRTPVMLIGAAENVVVLSRERTDLERLVEERLAGLAPDTPRMVGAMAALAGVIVNAYTSVTENLELSLMGIETELAGLGDEGFLGRTFQLRADILRVRSSLKHLKSVMRELSRGQLSIPGLDEADRELFGLLADDTTDLYDNIEDLRESLQALVDLRLNVSSFQMNRVMRLLALLTALALIPAIAGGLLGMNLQDSPWSASLAQVSFGVAAGMALSLYVFAIKGWLR